MKTITFFKGLLVSLMLMISASVNALDFEVDGIYYNKNSGGVSVCVTYRGSYYYEEYSGTVVIPKSVTYNGTTYSVTSIGSSAFSGCSSLTSVTIPESVTSIGDKAFYGCSSLTSVTIPEGVTSIGSSAFRDCSRLTSVTIPEGVTSIGSSVFYDCLSLTSVTIPESVTSIGSSAFYDCSSLTSVTIPESVTSIGSSAFYGCASLASVTIGSGVLSIGDKAFHKGESFYTTPINIKKVIWLANTPPTGYGNVSAEVNYAANDLYTGLKNVTVYPYLSSMFVVDGIKYVPVSPSERTCDAIDCVYSKKSSSVKIGNIVNYRGIEMKVNALKPYLCYNNDYIKSVEIIRNAVPKYAFYDCGSITNLMV